MAENTQTSPPLEQDQLNFSTDAALMSKLKNYIDSGFGRNNSQANGS